MIDLVYARRFQIADLCIELGVERLDVFGSASRGDFTSKSDLDFFADLGAVTTADAASRHFQLKHGLKAIFNISVDLVISGHHPDSDFLGRIEPDLNTIFPIPERTPAHG